MEEDGVVRTWAIGHVQSGKTTNYSALCSMAISAGYKVIIILAGTTNDLRKQTQERIEENLIGAVDSRTMGVGKIDGIDGSFTKPIALTNQSQDVNPMVQCRWSITRSRSNFCFGG